jgi:hypothetical protein
LKQFLQFPSLHNVHYRKLGNYIKKGTEPEKSGSVFNGDTGNL